MRVSKELPLPCRLAPVVRGAAGLALARARARALALALTLTLALALTWRR